MAILLALFGSGSGVNSTKGMIFNSAGDASPELSDSDEEGGGNAHAEFRRGSAVARSSLGAPADADEEDGPKRRGSSHVLLVGDPGIGKSQLLRAAANVAPRAVYVCGNTTSAAGLTVSAVGGSGGGNSSSSADAGGGAFGLEAGALVLADQVGCFKSSLLVLTIALARQKPFTLEQ